MRCVLRDFRAVNESSAGRTDVCDIIMVAPSGKDRVFHTDVWVFQTAVHSVGPAKTDVSLSKLHTNRKSVFLVLKSLSRIRFRWSERNGYRSAAVVSRFGGRRDAAAEQQPSYPIYQPQSVSSPPSDASHGICKLLPDRIPRRRSGKKVRKNAHFTPVPSHPPV